MTNEELIHDLKQFIEATVSQQTDRLEKRMDGFDTRMDRFEQRLDGMATDIKRVEQRFDAIQDAIADTLTRVTEALDTHEQVQDLDQRVTRLEQQAA